jgi:biotin transport system substrate-specific component
MRTAILAESMKDMMRMTDRSLLSRPLVARPLLALGGSLAIALSAQIAVPLEPVPMTMQSLVVLLVGLAGGPLTGASALLLYLAEGAAGLPVFANFTAGPAVLAGPNGGFLLGFVPAAALAGWWAARGWAERPAGIAAALLAGHAVLFAAGLAWLAVPLGAAHAVAVGFTPFLPGTLVKIALGTAFVAALRVRPRG